MTNDAAGNGDALPLDGVTVLDCGDEAVALASRWLSDLGARVIRIESSSGDYLRRRGPFLGNTPSVEHSLAHLRYNGGKESVALALDQGEAWEVVERLLAKADVVFAPLEKSEWTSAFFDDERLRRAHGEALGVVDPVFRIGAEACKSVDLLGVAEGGLLYLNGFPEDAPTVPAGKLAFKQMSLAAAEAAAALVLRQFRFGYSGRVTISLEEAVMWTTMQTANANFYFWQGDRPTRYGLKGLGAVGRTIYPTRDGGYVSFTINPPRWNNYADWIEGVVGDAQFKDDVWNDVVYRAEHTDDVSEATRKLCEALDRDALTEEGQRRGLLVTPVHSMKDLADDPHLADRGFLERVEHPQFDADLLMPRPPFFSTAYSTVNRRAPILGEHTRSVLRELGQFPVHQIDEMEALGTITCLADENAEATHA